MICKMGLFEKCRISQKLTKLTRQERERDEWKSPERHKIPLATSGSRRIGRTLFIVC